MHPATVCGYKHSEVRFKIICQGNTLMGLMGPIHNRPDSDVTIRQTSRSRNRPGYSDTGASGSHDMTQKVLYIHSRIRSREIS